MADAASLRDAIVRTEEARLAKIEGNRVNDIWRDGRRVRFSDMSIADLDAALTSLRRELERAESVEAGSSSRSAIAVYY